MFGLIVCAMFTAAPDLPQKLPPPVEVVKQYAALPKREDEINAPRFSKEKQFSRKFRSKCEKRQKRRRK